jgi:hypothetical protein
MIRYSSYHPSEQTKLLLCSVETEYRELLELRERVRKAEAAVAMRLRPQKKKQSGARSCPGASPRAQQNRRG